MKRLLYVITALLLLTNSGCKKFLEESSQNQVKPGTVQDLIAVMAGDAYPLQINLHQFLEFLSDDIECNGSQGSTSFGAIIRKIKSPYSWASTMHEDVLLTGGLSSGGFVDSWQVLYKQIANCNVVLDYIDKVTGDDALKQNLRGQALAMRAYYYFILVNLYGKPYNDPSSTPDVSLGVPLKLDMTVSDQFFKRNTVAEVYAQIEKDLLQAADLMKKYPKDNGIFKMSELAAYTILSRMYLYEENWDKTIEYTNKALAIKSILANLSNFDMTTGAYTFNSSYDPQVVANYPTNVANHIYDPAKSPEIIWNYLPNSTADKEVFIFALASTPYDATHVPPYTPSKELLNLYDSKPYSSVAADNLYLADLRSRLYFSSTSYFYYVGTTLTVALKIYYGGKVMLGLRVSELYLNRAEANINKFIKSGDASLRTAALSDINTLRAARYDNRQAYVPINITDGNDLLKFYKNERRRELAFEGHRWFDLRRYGMPSISHYYEDASGSGQTFVLAQGDSRYTLPIPSEVLQRNPDLVPNP